AARRAGRRERRRGAGAGLDGPGAARSAGGTEGEVPQQPTLRSRARGAGSCRCGRGGSLKVGAAKPGNVVTLAELLPPAQQGGYAVGSFSPRYPSMILP